jgi:hypothetical protein
VAKPVESDLIYQFLRHVEWGHISGRELTPGPAVLARIAQALADVLGGTEPDEALQIVRPKGAPSRIDAVLPAVHEMRKDKIPWPQIAESLHIADDKQLSRRYRERREHFELLGELNQLIETENRVD